jgi:hypothetical protein
MAFLYAGIPCVNSAADVLSFCDRPVITAALNRIALTHGREKFPLIHQQYFPHSRGLMYGLAFPCVVKFGSAHAGYGKMRVNHHHDMDDIRTLLPMTKDGFLTAEPFIDGEYDLRIQRIGSATRVFKRVCVNGVWKTNTGTSFLEEITPSAEHLQWCEWVQRMMLPQGGAAAAEASSSRSFGGLDIFTIDAIVERGTGCVHILEVNGSSSGLAPETARADNEVIRELVIAKLMCEVK